MKKPSEADENELFEVCWQEARELVTSSDALRKEAIRARTKERLGVLSEADRARFMKRFEAREDAEDAWTSASLREEIVRTLRDAIDAKSKT